MRIEIGSNFKIDAAGLYGKEGCNVSFLPIFKNAHTWGVEFFHKNYDFYKLTDYKPNYTVVFYRNPVERWFTGAVQFLINNFYPDIEENQNIVLDEKIIKFLFSVVCLDAHTELQRKYVLGYDIFSTYFFNIDDPHFYLKLLHWLDTKGCRYGLERKESFIDIERRNCSDISKLKISLITQLKNATLKNPAYLSNLLNYYNLDFELIRNINCFAYAVDTKNYKYGRKK